MPKCPKCESDKVGRAGVFPRLQDIEEELNDFRARPFANGRARDRQDHGHPAGRRPTGGKEGGRLLYRGDPRAWRPARISLLEFDGTARVIAHADFPKVHRVGKYGVDVEAIDIAADRLALDAAQVYLIDEIGKMECLSDRFVSAMRALLAGSGPVVATVSLHGSGFIEEVKRGEGAVIWEVTRVNRDSLPERVSRWLEAPVRPNV
jgi:NTPase